MIISGVQKTTFIDYPGKIASTLFLAGCNFRCPFCHNRNLVLNEKWLEQISSREVLAFLKKRRKYLEGVCITGGEPLIYNDLPKFLRAIKDLGYDIKLDTNGTNPRLLKEILEQKLLAYLAMDIKGSGERYNDVSGVEVNLEKIKASITLIMNSRLPYEFRSTILPRFHSESDIEKMAKMIKGAKLYYLQNFVARNTLDKAFLNERSFDNEDMAKLGRIAERFVEKVEIR
jgi:pyruvate formate lyase activating enzyme